MAPYKGDYKKGEIEIRGSTLQFSTPYFEFYQDSVIFPDETNGMYTRIEPTMGGVAILPVTSNDQIVLLKVFRHAVRSFSLEAPRGFVNRNESPVQAAMRELREELDVLAADFIHMGTVSPENSILNAHVHLYLAHHLVFNSRQDTKDRDAGAINGHVLVSRDCFGKMILGNDISDSYTLSLFARATLLGYL